MMELLRGRSRWSTLLFLLTWASVAASETPPRQVLLLYSYEREFAPQTDANVRRNNNVDHRDRPLNSSIIPRSLVLPGSERLILRPTQRVPGNSFPGGEVNS